MDVSFMDPMDFGMGIDSLTLRPRNPNAVLVPGLKSVENSGTSQKTAFRLINAETIEDYESALTFSADGAATFGMFGGSASFDLAQSHKFHSYSHFLVVSISVLNTSRQIDKPKLNPDTNATALLQAGHQDQFQLEFGDAFVQGIRQGGVFHAVMEFRTSTDQDLQDISGSITAGELGVFESEAKFSSRIGSFKGAKNIIIESFQQGGTEKKQSLDIDGIIERAVNFPAEVAVSAESFSATLLDYAAIDMPAPPNAVKIENAKQVIGRYYKLRSQILQMLNDVEYIKTNPDQFINPELLNFLDAETQLTTALNALVSNASTCADNISACTFIPVALPTITLPKRKGIKEMSAAFASSGEKIASHDELATLWLAELTDEANRQGFLIGLGIAESDTLEGPGKDSFGKQLPAEQQHSFGLGVGFQVDKNRHLAFYQKGAAVFKADPETAKARSALPPTSWVGFTIGSGIFAPTKLGGNGNTAQGPGSKEIHDQLSTLNQQGFDDAVAFYLHP